AVGRTPMLAEMASTTMGMVLSTSMTQIVRARATTAKSVLPMGSTQVEAASKIATLTGHRARAMTGARHSCAAIRIRRELGSSVPMMPLLPCAAVSQATLASTTAYPWCPMGVTVSVVV